MAVPFFRLLLLRLQVLILPYYICDARTGFLGVEVMMTYDEGLRIVLVQCFEQSAERSFLRLSARVGGLTASIIATFSGSGSGRLPCIPDDQPLSLRYGGQRSGSQCRGGSLAGDATYLSGLPNWSGQGALPNSESLSGLSSA